jgi:MoaA/NifB/PqqE/SkfB family radical SAM enzyme
MDNGYLIMMTGCRNDCVFCSVGKRFQRSESFMAEQEEHIEVQLKSLKGAKNVTLTGSDPIEYRQIVQLVKRLKQSGCQTINLATHGMLLSDAGFIKRLIDAGVDWFSIKLFGPTADIHDSVTQVKGSFDEVKKGIANVKDAGKNCAIMTQVLKQNKDHIMETVKLSVGMGCSTISINMTLLVMEYEESFYIPVKDLGQHISPVFDAYMIERMPLSFVDIPYCAFDKSDPKSLLSAENIFNKSVHVPESQEDAIGSNVRVHVKMCHSCAAFDKCDGFFKKDIDKYGTGSLKPLPK